MIVILNVKLAREIAKLYKSVFIEAISFQTSPSVPPYSNLKYFLNNTNLMPISKWTNK